MNTRREKSDQEVVATPQRVIDPLVGILATVFLVSFFAYHQLAQTGFFTARFGPFEMLCFYGPIILSLAAPIARAVTGRRNPGRLLQVVTNASLALAALWLLRVFPFDFTHLADALPTTLRFTVSWLTDEIGRIVLLLQVVLGTLVAFVAMITYLAVRVRASVTRSDFGLHYHQPV